MVTDGNGSSRLRRMTARILRVVIRVLLGALTLGTCLLLLLCLAPVRGGLLQFGLDLANRSLPGELQVGRASWPGLGRLEIEDLVWLADGSGATAGTDTLAHVRRLVLAVDLGALRNRDVRVDSLTVAVATLDVPAIAASFPAADTTAVDATDSGRVGVWTAAFPRAGALTGLPSLEVVRLDLTMERIRMAPDAELRTVRGTVGVDLTAGQRPVARFELVGPRFRLAGASPFELDLDSLACVAHYDTAGGWLAVDSLRAVAAALGPPDLAARWRNLPPAQLGARGRLRREGQGVQAALDLRIDMPGGGLLGAAWPQGLDVRDFAVVAAVVHADATISPDSVSAALDVDLADSPWLERGRFAGRAAFAKDAVAGGRIAVESLDIVLPRLALAGNGTLVDKRIAASFTVDAATPQPLLQAFVPALAEVSSAVMMKWTVAGTTKEPVLDVTMEGGVAAGPVVLPRAALALHGERDLLRVALTAAGGLARGERVWADSLAVTAQVRPAWDAGFALPRRIAAELACDLVGTEHGGAGTLRLRGDLAPDAPLAANVVVDTLAIVLPGLRLHASGRRDTIETVVALTAEVTAPCPLLEAAVAPLAGADYALGLAADARGSLEDPFVDVSLDAHCDAPIAVVPRFELEARGSRRDLQASLSAGGGLRVAGRGVADSVSVELSFAAATDDTLPLRAGVSAWRGKNGLGVLLAGGADSVLTVRLDTLTMTFEDETLRLVDPAVARWDTTARRLTLSPLVLAGSAGSVDVEGVLSRARTAVHAALDLKLTEDMLQTLAPMAFWSADGGMDLGVAGAIELEADSETARFAGELDVDLDQHRKREHLGANLRFRLAEGDSSGLAARFALTLDDSALLHGAMLLPGRFAPGRGEWVEDRGRALEFVVPEQTLTLGKLRRLYPEELMVNGTVTLAAAAKVPLAAVDSLTTDVAGRVDASLRTRTLKLDLPNNSRAEARADLTVSGTPADPRISGRIDVLSGFLRIPEIPRNLHPSKGKSLLWAVAGRDSAGFGYSAESADLSGWAQDADVAAPSFVPDLDLVVEVPGNLRIHGYGLETEVTASVTVKRGYDAKGRPGPSLDGGAQTVRGTLRFMNRTFEIRNAEVTFTGEVPANPLLDVLLEARIEGTTVQLRVTGRANAPVIDLTSDPDMNQADIMAFLLFGRPLNDLDADQRGRTRDEADPAQQMRENLAGLALAFGTADLQNSVSSTLGVDIVEVGSDSQGGSTLTAGKFLSPKILVKYNASLEKSGTYFVTLEYTLTQVFKIVSTYGQGEEASGLEVKWERRF